MGEHETRQKCRQQYREIGELSIPPELSEREKFVWIDEAITIAKEENQSSRHG